LEKNAVKGKRIADFTSNNLAAGDLKNSAQNFRFGILLMLLLLCIHGRRPNLALTIYIIIVGVVEGERAKGT